MVYRYSWIAGLASIGFAFWQLGRLLLPTGSGVPWQIVVLSGALIGLVVTWTAVSYRIGAFWIALINGAALLLTATRFAAPAESIVVLPTPAAFSALGADLSRAIDLIRYGVEPVRAVPGIVIIITALFWVLGALLAWGLSKEHPFVALLPPLVVALQFATLDRRNNGLILVGLFVALVGATLLSVALDERDRGAGRMASSRSRTPSKGPTPAAALVVAIAVAAAVFGAATMGSAVPRDGLVTWRTPGGLGSDFYGSVSYNPYVAIHKNLVSRQGIPLFRAYLDGDVSPSEVYFRLLTLDTYRKGQWSSSQRDIYPIDQPPTEQPGHEFIGPTRTVAARVEILGLSGIWLPAPYAVVGASGSDAEAFRIRRDDTALNFRGDLTYRGMEYEVISQVPDLAVDAITGVSGGGLSPLFSAAAADGQTVPADAGVDVRELPDADRYLQLPDDLDPRIRDEATALTQRLVTPFEKGLAIEHWFRETGGFVYDLAIDEGHGQDVLAAWLFDDSPENDGYRRGYCEQFATSMAVMTRSIGIPTRVVLGFTPGAQPTADQMVVLDKNAHSWVELWLPTAGWVAFDPTPRGDGANSVTSFGTVSEALGFDIAAYLGQVPEPARPAVDASGNPLGPNLSPADLRDAGIIDAPGAPGPDATFPGWIAITAAAALVVALLAAAIPIVKWARHRSRMRRLADGDISAAWEEMVVQLTDFGEEPDPAATPAEVAAGVDVAMQPLAAVYGRSVYGVPGGMTDDHAGVARRSMQTTSARLVMRYSAAERLRAHFRLRSLLHRFRP